MLCHGKAFCDTSGECGPKGATYNRRASGRVRGWARSGGGSEGTRHVPVLLLVLLIVHPGSRIRAHQAVLRRPKGSRHPGFALVAPINRTRIRLYMTPISSLQQAGQILMRARFMDAPALSRRYDKSIGSTSMLQRTT